MLFYSMAANGIGTRRLYGVDPSSGATQRRWAGLGQAFIARSRLATAQTQNLLTNIGKLA